MNNHNHIITILQNFEKPDMTGLKDKECLICLEPFDLESLNIVKLPCVCSNSVYHIDCIVKFLVSGKNKNFCPHCKTNYEIPVLNQDQNQPQFQASRTQIVPYIVVDQTNQRRQEEELRNFQIKNLTHILVFHIISNSIMNVINIVVARKSLETNNDEALQVLILFYFCKLFFNYCILLYSKSHIDQIEDCLVFSYVFQTVLFGLLVYSLTRMKNDDNFIILITNNSVLSFGDLTFRIFIEYRMKNAVVAG